MDRIAELIEESRMREIEIDRDTDKLARYLGGPLEGYSGQFGLTQADMAACREHLIDAARAAMARQLAEVQAEIDTLDAMTFTPSARSLPAGSVSH